MAKKLTKKEKGFVKDFVIGGVGSLAVKKHYDVVNDQTARAIAYENLTKPHIQEAIEDVKKKLADRIPDDLLEQVHLEGLRATKRSGTGGMKIGIGTDGQVSDIGHTEIDEPDYATRHKYLDSAYKLKGSYAAEKSVAVNVNLKEREVKDEELEIIREEYEEKLKAKLIQ